MSLDPAFIALLRCPLSQQPVQSCTSEVLTKLNGQIVSGTVIDEGGEPVARPLTYALMNQEGSFIYPVTSDVPNLLKARAIRL